MFVPIDGGLTLWRPMHKALGMRCLIQSSQEDPILQIKKTKTTRLYNPPKVTQLASAKLEIKPKNSAFVKGANAGSSAI